MCLPFFAVLRLSGTCFIMVIMQKEGSSKLRIAMIGQKEVPSRFGGIEVAVEALAVRMAARGHQVTLYNCYRYNPRKRAGKGKLKFYKGVHICEVPVPDIKGISTVLASLTATVLALKGQYDCIHYHAEGPAAMSFMPRIFGVRTVVTIHGLDWKRTKWGSFASWYLKKGEKTAVSWADEIIVLNQAAKEYFQESYHRKTVMIPNGIERTEKRKANVITQNWGLKKDGYILYLGRIVPEKGIENLIRAFFNVVTDKKLVIAGGLSDTKAFYKKIKEIAGQDSRVIFTGFVQGKELEELYSNSYIYCLPSELEGMPISLLEAISYGNCCLCSDIPECRELLENGGFLFKMGDIEDLCRVLQILCQHPEMVEKSRKEIKNFMFEKYDWDKITEKTLALYERPESSSKKKQKRNSV